MSNSKTKILAGVIISTAVTLAITSFWDDSLIVDEVPHIGAGYSYVVKQDLRLNPEHPPLAKILAGIPLLFLNLKQDAFEAKSWQSDVNGQWEFGRKLIYNSGNDADQIGHYAKLPMLLFFILAGILIFKWSRKLYGNSGGLIALTLFSFSPTILAHSRFVATDIPALFGIILGTYFFINYLQQNTKKNFWLASIAFGLALLTKFSTFLLVPYFLIIALIWGLTGKSVIHPLENSRGDSSRAKAPTEKLFLSATSRGSRVGRMTDLPVVRTILIFIVGILIIVWPVYFLTTYNYPPARQKTDTTTLLQSYGNRTFADAVIWASDKPVIRALAGYGLGLLMVNQRALGGNTTYFLGEVSRSGWHSYFPLVYFIKEPLAWWGLVILVIFTVIRHSARDGVGTFFRVLYTKKTLFPGASRDNFLNNYFPQFAMLLWLLIYWASSIFSNLNIGVRHLLPTYPFAILLVSGQLSRILHNLKKASRTVILISSFLILFLLSWYVAESVKAHPHYLTYFNQTVGGPSGGYKYVVDSNLDWGQDLKRFSQWVKQKNISKIELDYFGWADPSYYLGNSYIWTNSQKYKNAEDFRVRNKADGWLAVSATFLQGSQGPPDQFKPINYLWLKDYQPVITIGHSIFVYRIK